MTDPLTNPAYVIFVAISPLLFALFKQSGFPRQTNALIALIGYVVVGFVGALLSGEPMTLENAVDFIAVATVVGSAAYALIWNNLGAVNDQALSLDQRLTAATSIIRG